jgi:hypothetical protein
MPPIYGKARYMFKRTFTGSGSVWLSTRAREGMQSYRSACGPTRLCTSADNSEFQCICYAK